MRIGPQVQNLTDKCSKLHFYNKKSVKKCGGGRRICSKKKLSSYDSVTGFFNLSLKGGLRDGKTSSSGPRQAWQGDEDEVNQ